MEKEKKCWRYHFTHVYQDSQSYDDWFLRYGKIFCHLGPFFAFHFSNNPENQNFEKKKKKPGAIIYLQTCNINEDHMMYGS